MSLCLTDGVVETLGKNLALRFFGKREHGGVPDHGEIG